MHQNWCNVVEIMMIPTLNAFGFLLNIERVFLRHSLIGIYISKAVYLANSYHYFIAYLEMVNTIWICSLHSANITQYVIQILYVNCRFYTIKKAYI